MLQEWADMIDAWVDGRKRAPVITPPVPVWVPDPSLEQVG
jgi:hypothetical protein